MTDETVLLLTPVENYAGHRLARYIYDLLLVPGRFDLYFYQPLQQLFPKVILYDYLTRMIEVGPRAMNKEIIELAIQHKPKYVVWNTMYWYAILPSTFERVRSEGSTIAGWFLDDEVGFDNYSRYWKPYIDYFVTGSAAAVQKYEALGAKVIRTVPCTGNAIPRARWQQHKEYDVSFVGRRYVDRADFVNAIKSRNIPVCVFGREWENGEHVSYEEMIHVFASSKINLNFTKVTNSQRMLKGRMFEVCLAGGFLLTEYASGIETFFDIEKEIVCFETPDEMLSKITYYLSHEQERNAIAEAGWRRATAEYTNYHMFKKVFEEIEHNSVFVREDDRNGTHKRMQPQMHSQLAKYYCAWGVASSMENYNTLSRQALALSIRHDSFNARPWLFYFGSFVPYAARLRLIMTYRALYGHVHG